jgi:hypothetical protein
MLLPTKSSSLKEKSSKTKTRVVLDEGAKFSNGLSLNDTLQVGPTIQQDFYSVVLLFKTHQVWFTTDIAKIYRQIMLLPQNRNIEKFLGYILLKTPTRSTDQSITEPLQHHSWKHAV